MHGPSHPIIIFQVQKIMQANCKNPKVVRTQYSNVKIANVSLDHLVNTRLQQKPWTDHSSWTLLFGAFGDFEVF